MLTAAEPDLEARVVGSGIEQVTDIGGCFARDIEREMRQEVFDQVGLMRTKLVALAAPEERALPRALVAGRGVTFGRIAGGRGHRSVWYSR
jgi:hypothetical protein